MIIKKKTIGTVVNFFLFLNTCMNDVDRKPLNLARLHFDPFFSKMFKQRKISF